MALHAFVNFRSKERSIFDSKMIQHTRALPPDCMRWWLVSYISRGKLCYQNLLRQISYVTGTNSLEDGPLRRGTAKLLTRLFSGSEMGSKDTLCWACVIGYTLHSIYTLVPANGLISSLDRSHDQSYPIKAPTCPYMGDGRSRDWVCSIIQKLAKEQTKVSSTT